MRSISTPKPILSFFTCITELAFPLVLFAGLGGMAFFCKEVAVLKVCMCESNIYIYIYIYIHTYKRVDRYFKMHIF